MPDTLLEEGKTYRIPLKINVKSLSALQFALKINQDWGEIVDVNSGDLPNFSESNYAIFKEKGLVATAWSSNYETQQVKTILYVTVKAKKMVRLSQLLFLKDDFTEGVAYNAVGQGKSLKLQFTPTANELTVLPNYPNPFSDETILPFILPKDEFVQIKVYDLAGKLVKEVYQSFTKGYNEVKLNISTPSVNGILICHFMTTNKTIERKMILMR